MEINGKGGVLIIGSLYWQDHRKEVGDNERKIWRDTHLDMNNAINVTVPIKYGRFSGNPEKGNQTYTMVFDKTLDKAQYGTAKAVPFKNQPKNWEELKNEVVALSNAEEEIKDDAKSIFLRGNNKCWAVMSILFKSKCDKECRKEIIENWSNFVNHESLIGTNLINHFNDNLDEFCVSSNGELLIDWPDEANDFDYLIATSTKPKKRADNIEITPEEIAKYVNNRIYFCENINHGISTYDDRDILIQLNKKLC